MQAQLNLGQISYLNCWPLYHQLQDPAISQSFTLKTGHPAELNQDLENGEIDISPSSSILPAVSPINDYFVMPDIAITSLSEVRSVILLSRRPLAQLNGSSITLTSHSLTSIFLLKIILFHLQKLDPENIIFTTQEFTPKQTEDASLIIGDQALKFFHNPPTGFRIYDLGQIWYQFTGLPFVYALWIGRQTARKEKSRALIELHRRLTEIIAEIPGKLAEMAALALADKNITSTLNASQLLAYWQKAISYKLDQQALAGLNLFYQYASDLGLIDKIPTLAFFPQPDNS